MSLLDPVKPLVAALLLTIPVLTPDALDMATRKIEDDSSLRITLADAWFTEIPARVIGKAPIVHTLPGGGRVQVRVQTGQAEFAIILAREQSGGFPYWTQGSWMLTRRRDDGRPLGVQIFLRSDPEVYVRFRPGDGGKCLMDMVVYGAYIIRSQPIPVPLERIFLLPVEETLRLAGEGFPRRYFDPLPEDYAGIRRLIAQVREGLPDLRFRDDGAIDEQGRYVFINTLEAQDGPGGLNCSGFAKWLIDGLLQPLTGELLTIPPLKEPYGDRGSSFTDPYEALRDPFFGLDWTRNLAARANSVLKGGDYSALREIEVRRAPFALLGPGKGSALRPYTDFRLNAGFDIEGLEPLLYTLAIDEPGCFYLASINTEMDPSPRMRQHFHVAALLPYFTESGAFRVVVFESATETSFARFKIRYPHHQINLTRVPAGYFFNPPRGQPGGQ
jgi:hypothetical protein